MTTWKVIAIGDGEQQVLSYDTEQDAALGALGMSVVGYRTWIAAVDERGVEYLEGVGSVSELPPGWALCNACRRGWNDEKSTSVTPTPSARCPFEYEHDETGEASVATCKHCGRTIVNEGGGWIDPEATGDDSVWRETCEAHDTFTAEHEPTDTAQEQVPPRWVVKEIPDTDEPGRFYVQDSHLGYCTDPTDQARAREDARRLNREQPW